MLQGEPKTIAGVLYSLANFTVEVELSTGTVIRGKVSPFSEDSEYTRLNSADGRAGHTIPLRHIVRLTISDPDAAKA
jgi:hypothetical protein